MKLFLLITIFSPLLVNVFRQKDWYICLLFAMYPILPNTFAISIASYLPLFTAGRFIIILNILFYLNNNGLKVIFNLPRYFYLYFITTISILVIDLYQSMSGIGGVINILLEQVILLLIIVKAINTEKDFYRYIDYLIYGFAVSAFVGILQTIAQIDLSTPLHIVTDRQEMGLNLRMGFMRACGLSTSAIAFACENAIMILLTMFLYEKKRNVKYIFFMGLFCITMLCTMSRSSWVAIGIILLIMLIVRFRTIVIEYFKFLPFVFFVGLVAVLLYPKIISAIIEPIKTILNFLGAEYKVVSTFGDNSSNMAQSRLFQWSALQYMIDNGKILFGYGYNAYVRGAIHFYFSGYNSWDVAQAVDVGFVTLICERGIIGFIIYLVLLIKIFFTCWARKGKAMSFYRIMCYIIVLYILENIFSSCIDNNIFIILLGLFCSIYKINNKKLKLGDENERRS